MSVRIPPKVTMALFAALCLSTSACGFRGDDLASNVSPPPTVKAIPAPQEVASEGKGDLDVALPTKPQAQAKIAAAEPAPAAATPHQAQAKPAEAADANPPPNGNDAPGSDDTIAAFRAKLAALETGKRKDPVVVLHIGDSHIAADSFSRGIRERLQARFGNAGRGAVIPAAAFKGAAEQGVTLTADGSWNAAMSLHDANGVYGVSGVRVSSSSPSAVMKLASDQEFDTAAVTVATGPQQGSFTVTIDGKPHSFSSAGPQVGAKTFEIAGAGHEIELKPSGNGDVALLNWATTRHAPGLRYVNFGQIGSTVRVTERWNANAVANDVRTIKPDLIVYGFGTNEGFDDNTDLNAYRQTALKFVNEMKAAAPGAAVVIIGAGDSLRRGNGASCGNGWASPPKLAGVRQVMKGVAKEIGAFYWDWSEAMGGQCAMARWAGAGLGTPDHIHLTKKGYDVSAERFTQALLGPLAAKATPVASVQ